MGRYSSVQAYADNNASKRAVSYEQATGSSELKKGVVKAEKVVNPYGSTAGANSGDFHLYRHARAREIERLKAMDRTELKQQKDLEFEAKLEQYKTEEEKRTEKRRKKRQREKQAKQRKKNLEKAGIATTTANSTTKEQVDEEEFTYVPIHKQGEIQEEESSSNAKNAAPVIELKNDGSFLEQMKKLQETTKEETAESTEEPPAKRQATEGDKVGDTSAN